MSVCSYLAVVSCLKLLGYCVLSEATRLLCLVCSPLACYLSGVAQGTHWCPFAASGIVAVL